MIAVTVCPIKESLKTHGVPERSERPHASENGNCCPTECDVLTIWLMIAEMGATWAASDAGRQASLTISAHVTGVFDRSFLYRHTTLTLTRPFLSVHTPRLPSLPPSLLSPPSLPSLPSLPSSSPLAPWHFLPPPSSGHLLPSILTTCDRFLVAGWCFEPSQPQMNISRSALDGGDLYISYKCDICRI